jgi:hypothetical protein
MAIVEYPFPDAPADTSYCVFPTVLENNELVVFHATPAKHLEAIIKDGFRIPGRTGVGLQSVSFAKRSVTALTHAMIMRGDQPVSYCILAVLYNTLDRNGLVVNVSDVHDYTLDPAPQIIGYCMVPASYVHV